MGQIKYTIEDVKKSFKEDGYECLEDEYINSRTKMKCRCDKGHLYSTTWTNWQQKHRCKICVTNAQLYTIKFVKKSFKEFDYECLEDEYISVHSDLNYSCPKGHKHFMSFSNWQQGARCPSCYYETIRNKINDVNKSFEKYDYELLTKKYINNKQKLDYICPKGHRHSTTWKEWRRGRRCPTCNYDNQKIKKLEVEIQHGKVEFQKNHIVKIGPMI